MSEQRYLKGIFLSGFCLKVMAKIKLHRNRALAEMIIIAQMLDEQNRVKEEEERVTVVSKGISTSHRVVFGEGVMGLGNQEEPQG